LAQKPQEALHLILPGHIPFQGAKFKTRKGIGQLKAPSPLDTQEPGEEKVPESPGEVGSCLGQEDEKIKTSAAQVREQGAAEAPVPEVVVIEGDDSFTRS
jgi:hypothetical protein